MGLRSRLRLPVVVAVVIGLTAVIGSRLVRSNVAPPTGQSAAAAVHLTGATLYTLTVALKIAGNGGAVTSSPAGISCSTRCSASFPSGETVKLTESSLGGLAFTGWSGGGCAGSAMTCAVRMSRVQSVSASFTSDLTGAVTGPSGSRPASSCPGRSYGLVAKTV